MLPKAQYMALSRAEKAKVKKSLGMPLKRRVRQRKNDGDNLNVSVKGLGSTLGKVVGKGSYSLSDYKRRPFRTMGGRMGEYLGTKIGSVFGSGPYAVKSNTLLDQGQTPPQFKGGINNRICHREYIQDVFSGPTLVNGATAFNIQSFNINPGLEATFPWLAAVAENYEEYRINGMMFEYRPMSGNALTSANTALGTVILATQYNAAASPFVSKQQMENYEFAQSVVPSEQVLHYIECEPRQTAISTELYVRPGAVPIGQDIRLYDWGTFFIATQGMQAANVNLGELWVTFDVELFKPKLISGSLGLEVNYFHAHLGSTVSTSNYFGTSQSVDVTSTFLPSLGSTTIVFPSGILDGQYLIQYVVLGASTAHVIPSFTATSNCGIVRLWQGNTTNFAENASATGTILTLNFCIEITGPSAIVTFSGGTLPTSPVSGDLIIYQMPNGAD